MCTPNALLHWSIDLILEAESPVVIGGTKIFSRVCRACTVLQTKHMLIPTEIMAVVGVLCLVLWRAQIISGAIVKRDADTFERYASYVIVIGYQISYVSAFRLAWNRSK